MARYIETETVDGIERRWYELSGIDSLVGGEFAVLPNGRLLDRDGYPADYLPEYQQRAICAAIEQSE